MAYPSERNSCYWNPNESLLAFSDLLDATVSFDGVAVMTACRVYFDESGTHDTSPVMTIAAYAFTPRNARLFSRDWARDLQKFGLSCAHMTDCALGFGEYEAMPVDQRVAVEKALIKHTRKRSIIGICASLSQSEFEEEIGDLAWGFTSYTFLLLLLINKFSSVLPALGFAGPRSYFFESGHNSAGEANSYMNFAARDPIVRNGISYSSHAFVDKKVGLPLQAADMLAWQHRHFLVRRKSGHSKMRKDFVALVREHDLSVDIQSSDIKNLGFLLSHSKSLYDTNPQALSEFIASIW
jgi:hypothetical protein